MRSIFPLLAAALLTGAASAQVAVRAKTLYTVSGAPIANAVVVIEDGKITAVGPAAQVTIPAGMAVIEASVVTPGLVDARSVVGLAGIVGQKKGDQDQHEDSAPIQPELRALDAYNPKDRLVAWVRGFGVTTVQTGHAPAELIPGQLFIVKTKGRTADAAAIVPFSAVAATLTTNAQRSGAIAPGTRGKMVALLRAKLIEAQEYAKAQEPKAPPEGEDAEEKGVPARDLGLEAIAAVLAGDVPLVVTANRAQDIASALRVAKEFKLRIVLDGAAEAYLLLDEIKAAGCAVILHPTMQRSVGETKNLSFETAAKLHKAGIPFAIQSGYEPYVPKARVVLFEAGVAASHGLGFDGALRSITLDAAKILGVDSRVGSIEIGKDGDLALYDGDPFEYTTHCVGTVIEGELVSSGEKDR